MGDEVVGNLDGGGDDANLEVHRNTQGEFPGVVPPVRATEPSCGSSAAAAPIAAFSRVQLSRVSDAQERAAILSLTSAPPCDLTSLPSLSRTLRSRRMLAAAPPRQIRELGDVDRAFAKRDFIHPAPSLSGDQSISA